MTSKRKKQQRCKNNDCGRTWPYAGNKKKGGKTRCPDCQTTVTILSVFVALLILPLAGAAYADQQVTLELPIDRPFDLTSGFKCQNVSDGLMCFQNWFWGVSDEIGPELPTAPDTLLGEEYSLWLEEILPLVENNPVVDIPADDIPDDSTPDPIDEPKLLIEELDPEVRRALDKLGECQFGEGAWAAFVSNYTREVPDELPIFTSGLDKNRLINELAKNFEECRGMTEYQWLSAEYENKFLADTLGLDLHGRPEINTRGNEPSLMFEMTAEVTEAEKRAEADKWETWMCAEHNLHLGLCGHDFHGTNRGGYTGGADCQELGQPATEGGTAAANRCPMEELAQFEAAQPTTVEILEKVHEAICDEYGQRYESYEESKRPEWIKYCYE